VWNTGPCGARHASADKPPSLPAGGHAGLSGTPLATESLHCCPASRGSRRRAAMLPGGLAPNTGEIQDKGGGLPRLASVGALASLCLIQPRRLHQHERWLHGKGHLHQGVESKDLAVEGLTVRGVHHNGTQASVADMAAVLQSDVLVSPWLKPVAGVTPRGAVRKVPPAVLGAPEGVLGVLHSAVWPGGDEGAADDALWPEPFPVAMWVEGSSIVDREHPIGDDSPTSITSEAGCVP